MMATSKSSFGTEPCGCYKERGLGPEGEVIVMSKCVFHRHLHTCPVCFALVLPENAEAHKRWGHGA